MPRFAVLSAALLGLAALSGCAQDAIIRQQASAAKNADCATIARKALHDHGIERGYGPMPVKACSKTSAAY